MAPRDRRLYPWAVQGPLDPIEVVASGGSRFTDASGREWLDMASQLAYANLGHGHPRVVEAIRHQAAELAVIAPSFANRPATRLAELLVEVAPRGLTHVFFTNGGADANEHAIRMARAATGRLKVVSRYQSYHGATLGAISATGENRRFSAEPIAPGFVKAPDPYRYRCRFCGDRDACTLACAGALEDVVVNEGPESVAAVLVEPITGTSGLVVPPDGYLRRLRELCDRFGIVLIFDEVITGFCRTGRWFASEHWDVAPDIMTVAKGITSGYVPLGAAVVNDRVAATFDAAYMGSGLTYSAHPLACAAGCAAVEAYLEERLAERAAGLGESFLERLRALGARHPCVGEVRGKGFLAGIELVSDRATRQPLTPQRTEAPPAPAVAAVRASLARSGIYALHRWNLVIFAPPLNIAEADLDVAHDALDAALSEADRLLP